jgi:PAS domain S-box-containing protein
MILSINDITDQAKAAEAVANEAILRRVLIQNSRDGIVILDDSGKVFEANRRFCEILGYTPEEIKNLYVWDWDTWDRDNLLKSIRSLGEAGDHFEIKQKRKDGTMIDVEVSLNGATIAGEKMIFSVCRDITQRKQMERALRESEEKFSKAFHAGPEIAAITTLKDGKFIDINENYVLFTGYTREDLIGQTPRSLGIWVNPEDRIDMLKTLETEGKVSKKEYRFYNKSGQIRTWLFSADQVAIGDEPCLLCVSIDITDQKLIEAKAQEAENLREIDKLRRELLANVSHELRTPLASIKGFTTMLMDYGKRLKPSEKQEYLDTIDKNADRLVELIEQLLEMSRLGAGMVAIKKKPTNVAELCRSVVKEARVRASNHIFTLDIPRRLPLVEIDDRRIRQVLDNLINNSVKYSDAGTEIIVSARKKDNDMLFAVIDYGSGIPEKDIPHVFERMFSVRSRKNPLITGAGLGLAICKGLIEAHDGKIWCESKEGAGTSCFFTVPLKAKPTQDTADAGKKKPAAKK